MILDAFQQFSNAQAITTGAAASTNVLDYGGPAIPVLANLQGARDMGIGDDPALKLMVDVTTTFTSNGAGTLTVAIQGAPDNGSGAPGSYTTWWTSPAYALATLNAGSRLFNMDFPRPPDGVGIPRFVRLLYTVATADFTAGNISAFVVLDRDDQPYSGTDNSVLGGYPAGLNVAN
jgi:hypothetical protein